jgi:uncharacterized membrane protein YoaK (UPF0700 family)
LVNLCCVFSWQTQCLVNFYIDTLFVAGALFGELLVPFVVVGALFGEPLLLCFVACARNLKFQAANVWRNPKE